MRITPRSLALLALLAWIGQSSPAAQTRFMSVDEIRVGMTGTGRTVFSGTKLEDFQVHILGVIRNLVGPSRNLILARLDGGPLAKTGVIAGMSGSPVYIDGRLIGAISYALGQFSTEPIAGITPIAEMTEATAPGAPMATGRPVAFGSPLRPTPDELFAVWARDLGRALPFSGRSSDARILLGNAATVSASMGPFLRPIAVPLSATGFEGRGLDALDAVLAGSGFVAVGGAQPLAGTGAGAPRTLAPGDAVGVTLLSGDFEIGATGTVTHVDGNRVYAFGHPLYNLGPTEFPMTTAEVQVVLPSLQQSSKLASLGPVVGTLQQDRATAIAGTLGPGPSLIQVSVTLNSDRNAPRTFSFGVVRDPTFTPLLTYLAVANVLTSYERAAGPATYALKGAASIRAHGDITFEDIFTGEQPAGAAAAYVAGPLTLLAKNANAAATVEKITLTIDAAEQLRSARIERVWLDTVTPRAGAKAVVHVSLRGSKGEEIVRLVPIEFPANVTGTLQLLVADAARMGADDRRDARGADLQNVTQIVRTWNRGRRSNRLYVRLSTTDQGAIVNGEPMAALPASVLAVLDGDRASGNVSSLRTASRGEWNVPLDVAVTGSRTLTITLDQSR